MTYECLLYEVKDGVATLTLNRPDRLNALGSSLRDDLHDAITRSSTDPDVRVMVITGAGKGFCSGGDVKAMQEAKDGKRERPLIEKIAPGRDRTLLAMREAPQPIIAAINGAAAGAGMNLALGCDIRIASTAAKFSQAFVKRGLHPDWGGTYFLPRVVGMARAAEMIFTGEVIDAAEALRLGIVSRIVAPEELLPTVGELARRIAAGRRWRSAWPSTRSTPTPTAICSPRWRARPRRRTSASRRKTRARASAHSSRNATRCSAAAEVRI